MRGRQLPFIAQDNIDIYQVLHCGDVKALIAKNGRGFYKSEIPKDKGYCKRWFVERISSRLKELFGLAKQINILKNSTDFVGS